MTVAEEPEEKTPEEKEKEEKHRAAVEAEEKRLQEEHDKRQG